MALEGTKDKSRGRRPRLTLNDSLQERSCSWDSLGRLRRLDIENWECVFSCSKKIKKAHAFSDYIYIYNSHDIDSVDIGDNGTACSVSENVRSDHVALAPRQFKSLGSQGPGHHGIPARMGHSQPAAQPTSSRTGRGWGI